MTVRELIAKLVEQAPNIDATIYISKESDIESKDLDEFKIIRPKGGGGTSFDIIFDYVEKEMEEEPPVSIVILTDGYAPIPDESRAGGIPVLWIINNDSVTPPWGKIARILD